MISPDRHIGTRMNAHTGLLRELRLGAIFVQPSHGEPAIARDFFRVVHRDQAIGVAWISDHEDAHVGRSIFLNRLALADENLAVDAEQILAFHARPFVAHFRRATPNSHRGTLHRDRLWRDGFQQRERAIVQFHDDAFERTEHGRNFDQMKPEGWSGPNIARRRCETGERNRFARPRR